ncbi:MAG: enoyl-CoA hydratase/isomerase family protein [Dehalococcoidia bacterium]|nr:MAG: enoyl-CoA hydratase/isomerase family protein [Dehalococcoidia bacterium]
MPYEHLIYDRQDHVVVITLNRPERMNAMNRPLHNDLMAACAEAQADDEVRAIVLTGAGRGFCSGADVSAATPEAATRVAPPPATQRERLDQYQWMGDQAMAVYRLDKPVVAAMNGVCVGAGMSLALACDMRVGSEQSRFRAMFLERNLSPDSGMSWLLPRIIGYSRAFDVIGTSRDIDGEEAYRLGMLDRFVPPERLMDESLALATRLAAWPPLAIRAAKRVIQQNMDSRLEDGLRNEIHHISQVRTAVNDTRESRAARAEQRPPHYTGT